MLKRCVLAGVLALCFLSVSFAEGPAWRSVTERRDFPIADEASVLDRACEELRSVYGADLDAEALKKNKSYINSVRSEKYKAEIITVMIEDRSAGEPDCYYEVVFEMPDMTQIGVGGLWLSDPLTERLDSLMVELYDETDFD
ncbi:MAG: hypothetical protein LBQ36_01230 [Synergistaceae bacterium]|jgi:hypothetical protein|nr:hypothetical protein [Synergistaceae bacterium]